jgi:hypothetical protein
MGVDLFAIMGHGYGYREIIDLQERIENDAVLNNLSGFRHPKESVVAWKTLCTEESLERFWLHNERREEVDEVFMYDYLPLPTSYGNITFHRHIVSLNCGAARLWTLSLSPEATDRIFSFNARLAEIFGQRYILYYGDSWAKSCWIEDWIFGKTMEEILIELTVRGVGNITDVKRSVEEHHLYFQTL